MPIGAYLFVPLTDSSHHGLNWQSRDVDWIEQHYTHYAGGGGDGDVGGCMETT
jgi:hypothetical protein